MTFAKCMLSVWLVTSIKHVCYSKIGSQGSHLPAPLQQPYVSVHHAHTLRQTVGSNVLHRRHNLSVHRCFHKHLFRLYCNEIQTCWPTALLLAFLTLHRATSAVGQMTLICWRTCVIVTSPHYMHRSMHAAACIFVYKTLIGQKLKCIHVHHVH